MHLVGFIIGISFCIVVCGSTEITFRKISETLKQMATMYLHVYSLLSHNSRKKLSGVLE